jgi:predicted nucleotidyltransferase
MTEAEIANLPGVAEGLEKRVARCAREAASQDELIDMLKCKRYTRARIARLCAHALLGITRELQEKYPLPEYARIIGMRESARPLLAELKARSTLPIVSDAAKLTDNEIFCLECRATDLRALQCNESAARKAGQEFTQKFIRI